MTIHRPLLLLVFTLTLTACGLKGPLLLRDGNASGVPPTAGKQVSPDTPLCAGGSTNGTVQGECQ